MINRFGIKFVKIIIIKINIIKHYTIKAYIITKECNIIRAYITKDYISLENTALSSFSVILFITNYSGTNFVASRLELTALSHIYWVLYLSGQYFR